MSEIENKGTGAKPAGALHKGHRARMKKRFSELGGDSFADHEILEMLLYYAIPQRDTNEIAHILLQNFGSIKGVIDASPAALREVPYVGENVQTLLKLIPEVAKRYLAEDTTREFFDNNDKIGRLFVNKYIGATEESVYLLLLDNSLRLIECKKMFEGSVNSAMFDARTLTNRALNRNAPNAVVAHNHPYGKAIPSNADYNATESLASSFELVGVNFLGHFIVAGNRYVSVESKRYGSDSRHIGVD